MGIDNGLEGEVVGHQRRGPTVFAPFPEDTAKLADLDAMPASSVRAGIDVEPEVHHEPQVGRFGWARDPEGNRIELWELDPTGSTTTANAGSLARP